MFSMEDNILVKLRLTSYTFRTQDCPRTPRSHAKTYLQKLTFIGSLLARG